MFDNPYLCQSAIAHHPLASHPSVIAYCDRMAEKAEASGEDLIEGLAKVLEDLGDASFETLEKANFSLPSLFLRFDVTLHSLF